MCLWRCGLSQNPKRVPKSWCQAGRQSSSQGHPARSPIRHPVSVARSKSHAQPATGPPGPSPGLRVFWPETRLPPPPTVSLVLLAPIQQAGQGRHCHGWEARGKDGENHSRAFLLSLGDERTQRTLTISHRKIPSSVSLRARHSVTLNRVRMKMQDF